MATIYVWTLVMYMTGHREGGPAVIDNIATMQECERVADLIRTRPHSARCIQVEKLVMR